MDLLQVVENLCAHYQERHSDVMRWPWKLFCAKWVRVLEAIRQQQRERREREIEHGQRRLAEKHQQQWGNG